MSDHFIERHGDGPGVRNQRLLAILFGMAFGFLLQKGGATKFNVLIGVLLLKDFTVLKVMMSAILVGMLGIFVLHRIGKVRLHIEPTRLGAQTLGGLVFGIGFALLAYCPGTGAAALGQGNWDALFGMAGLVLGSYVFAELSQRLSQSVQLWGAKGKLLLPDLLHVSRTVAVFGTAAVLTVVLIALERFTPR